MESKINFKEQYKVQDIDFKYEVNRRNGCIEEQRYYLNNGVYEQIVRNESNRAVILCCGDLMCEPAMSEAAFFGGEYDFRSCFKYIRPVLAKSDLVLANLETMVTDLIPYAHEKHVIEHHTGRRYHCNAPVSYLKALRYAGFDGFCMANNHSADGGYDGLVDTINNVDSYKFMRTGAFKDENESRFMIVNVNGIRVAILSYTEHINRNLDKELFTDKGSNVMLNKLSLPKLVLDIKDAKAKGAEFILAYIHFLGKEYSHEVLAKQRETAQTLADNGVDCIIGTHTHSIQEYDVLIAKDNRKVPVVYSLGNFITSDGTSMITRTNIIYKLVLEKRFGKVEIYKDCYIPCRVVEDTLKSGYKVFPTQEHWRSGRPSSLLDKAQSEISQVIGKLSLDDGVFDDGDFNGIPILGSKLLSVGKICDIIHKQRNDISMKYLNLKADYFTARYTWVRKGCFYFSRYIDRDIEEREARLAYQRGASVLFCTRSFKTVDGKDMPCVIVSNPAQSFYEVNRYIRSLYDIPTIGVTGSVGKTTTKEMVYSVLSTKYNTLKNSGNSNTYAGIADTTHKLNKNHQVYIQEICAFAPGWVEGGSHMLKPDMCIITNIGYPHVDLYGSIENILYDKTSLVRALPDNGVAFLNYDDERLSSFKTNKKVISFGIKNNNADYVAQNVVYDDQVIRFTIHCEEGDFPAVINMVGEHNVLNALVAFAVGRHMKIEANTILEALNNYRSEGMRQNVLNIGGYNIYMDCYNSAPNSVLTSVHALSLMSSVEGCKKVAVIGDIPRLGNRSEEVHKDVGAKLVDEEIDLYLFFGKYARATYDVMKSAGKNVLHTESREQLNSWLKEIVNPGDFILFKAGHPMALAKTVDQVYGTSFHLTDGDVLLENSRTVHSIYFDGRWIDGVIEIRRPRFDKSSVEIPEVMDGIQVVRIGNSAFSKKGLKTLSTSKGLRNIGVSAFAMCNNLTDIKFAEGLMVLEEKSFYQCGLLNNVVLPKGLIEIGSLAFGDCKSLQKIYVPASVKHICKDVFSGCKDLTIYCSDDSYAKVFAMEQGYKVEVIENIEASVEFREKSLIERGILWMKGKA